MRIGQFSDTFFPIVDGVGRVVYNYAMTIAGKGHECYVVAPMADRGYMGGAPFELIEFVSRNLPKQKQYQTGIPLLDTHYNMRIQKVQLDIIHAHSPFIAGQEALRIGRRRGIPVIGTFHSKYYDDFYQLTRAEMLADIGVRYVVGFYERCDEVWTVSYSSADTLRDYGYTGRIVVMPNGTPDVAPTDEQLALARERFHLGDAPVFLYCGQMNWKKNIGHILEAMALLRERGADFQLVLAGTGPDVAAIQKLADSLSLGERTVCTGHLCEDKLLNGLYQAATMFVFPSLYDTSGMVVREAAAMGTASVVVRGSAAAEAISDGENGLLCEDTPESLAATLQRTLDEPDLARRLGECARKTIYLPWPEVIDRVLDRYEHLVEEHRTASRVPLEAQ